MHLARGTGPGAYANPCPFCLFLSNKTYKLVTQIGIRKSGKEAMVVHLVRHEASCIPSISSNVPRRGRVREPMLTPSLAADACREGRSEKVSISLLPHSSFFRMKISYTTLNLLLLLEPSLCFRPDPPSPCAVSCGPGLAEDGYWSHIHDLRRLNACNETTVFQTAVYNSINDPLRLPATWSSFYSCYNGLRKTVDK